jgi:hypothetical protein
MSWKSLSAYPLSSPFYPTILPYQKYLGSVSVTYNRVMNPSETIVITQNVPALPANSTILFFSTFLTNEEIYTPADLRVSGCRLVNSNTQYEFTIETSANIVGTHRTYVTFNLYYVNNAPL